MINKVTQVKMFGIAHVTEMVDQFLMCQSHVTVLWLADQPWMHLDKSLKLNT